MSLLPSSTDWHNAVRDIRDGVSRWEIWYLLGVNDIRARYKRSRFGQFWITLSMAAFVGGIGIVYSFLFQQPVHDYIPYLAVNYIVWTLIQGMIMDSGTVFTQATTYLTQEALPKSTFVMRLIVRNLIAFAHNIVIIPLVFLIFGVVPSPTILLAIPGLVLLLIAGFLASVWCGVLCTRFRDLPQIIQNVMQIAFFLTPIMWQADRMTGHRAILVDANPFASFLKLVGAPIRGEVPEAAVYWMALGWTALLFLVTAPLFARFRSRIVYWL